MSLSPSREAQRGSRARLGPAGAAAAMLLVGTLAASSSVINNCRAAVLVIAGLAVGLAPGRPFAPAMTPATVA